VLPGTYKLHTLVFYDGRQGEADYFLSVAQDSVALDKGLSGHVVATAGKDNSSVLLLALAAIALIVINIFLIMHFRKNNNQPPPPSSGNNMFRELRKL